jgi:hypothetical protein
MTELRSRMIQDMQLHGLAARTQQSYVDAVKGLARFYRRSPANRQQLRMADGVGPRQELDISRYDAEK